jgi:SAM-dependent methyltransferase
MSPSPATVGTGDVSAWIPRRRITIARTIALGLFVAALCGSALWWPAALLVVPALAVAWVAFVMTRIRTQLSGDGDGSGGGGGGGGGWERRIHELVTDRLGLSAQASISLLDIGCGDAGLIDVLLRRSPSLDVTGIDLWSDGWDYSQAACEERLARTGRRAEFRRMSAGRLDLPDQAFDAVVSVMCFHEVPAADGDGSGPVRATLEALRVLAPGGRFVLVDRFADRDLFDASALDAAFGGQDDVARERLVELLDIPWPLGSRRSLGQVLLISGTKSVP